MGILDKAKEALGGGGKAEEQSFEDEFEDSSFDEEFEQEQEETEPEPEPEWDTAYQFADDVIEEVGFVGLKEFIDKAMIYRVNMSPMYRDKIQSGVQTMDMISSSMSNIHELQGEFDSEERQDYKHYADEVRAANNLIDELDRMEGKEEEMANEIIGIARDFVEGMNSGGVSKGSVDNTMGVVRED